MANRKKNKHMSFDDRLEIQECLNRGMTFKAIAQRIGKDQTTVSKEVKKHLDVQLDNIRRTDAEGNAGAPEVCPLHLRAPFVKCRCRHFTNNADSQ